MLKTNHLRCAQLDENKFRKHLNLPNGCDLAALVCLNVWKAVLSLLKYHIKLFVNICRLTFLST